MLRRDIHRLPSTWGEMQPRWLRGLSTAQRKALACTLISLIGWSLWNGLRRFDHPWGDLSHGGYSDHLSHMNAARVFPRIGLDIWRRPLADQFRRLDSDELAQTPEEIRVSSAPLSGGIFRVPGWPTDKPLALSWSMKPRMYPPGDMLLVAPVALLYHYTSLSLTGACRLLLALFIVTAHAALFLFFLTYFESRGSAIAWLACFFAYSNIMHWTLEGFYDPIAIVPLVLCARYLACRRGLAAVVAYCVGAVLHFRVFFQAPWVLCGAWLMIRGRFWRDLRARTALAIAVAVGCAVVSLYVFSLDWNALRDVAVHNPVLYASATRDNGMLWNHGIIVLVCLVAFALCRAWLDLAMLAWLALITVTLREFYWWHLLIPMSWLAAPSKRDAPRGVRLAFLVTVLALAFKDTFAPSWLSALYHAH